jgi:hypothetical protein
MLAHLLLAAGPQSSARRPVVLPGRVSIHVVGTWRDDRHLSSICLLAIVVHRSFFAAPRFLLKWIGDCCLNV